MPAGKPRMYQTPEEIQAEIDSYFSSCDAAEEPYTITGLALYLGFTSRQALINYQERPEFVDTIKKAKLRVECGYEKRLSGQAATGAIFALKNFDWKDKQDIEHSGGITVEIVKFTDENQDSA